MAKELPYFRFTASEWLNDDISLEDYETKGLFIDICAFYWFRDCNVSLLLLEKRFKNDIGTLKQLVDLGIITLNNNETITIKFLDEQYDMLSEKRKARQYAGSKGGKKGTRWSDIERKEGSQLYVLLFSSDKEVFVKVGITEVSIAKRYSVPNGYKIETLYQLFSDKTSDLENVMSDILKEHSYLPKNKFGGYMECYSTDSLTDIHNKMIELKTKPLVNINQTLIKAQANLKQTVSYKDKDKDKEVIKDVSGSKNEPDTTPTPVEEGNKKLSKEYDYSREIELLNKIRFLFDSKYYTTPAGRKSWLDVIRLLNTKDGYSYELIEDVIKFGRSDQFWKINFLSISGLRKIKDGVSKFDKMLAAKGGSKESGIKKFVSRPLGSGPSTRGEKVEKFKYKKLG